MDSKLVVAPVKRIVPSVSVITDECEKCTYWNILLKYWKLPKHINHFPAANPVSLERNNFDLLKEDDYLAALKTDGVRHLLLLTTKPHTVEPIAIMIDRSQKMYEVEVWGSEGFFVHGSLFDGELVWNKEKFDALDFMVFDVIRAKGVDCIDIPYRDRLQVLHDTILIKEGTHDDIEECLSDEDKIIMMNNTYNMHIMPKKCVPKHQVRSLWEQQASSTHRNDGLIFTKNACSVQMGTCNAIFKWKPHHSIDVRIDAVHNIYGNADKSSDIIQVIKDEKNRTFILQKNRLLEVMQHRLPCVMECFMELKDNTIFLIPERERIDKKTANTMYVIAATIRNVEESISVSELHKLLS